MFINMLNSLMNIFVMVFGKMTLESVIWSVESDLKLTKIYSVICYDLLYHLSSSFSGQYDVKIRLSLSTLSVPGSQPGWFMSSTVIRHFKSHLMVGVVKAA